LHRWALLVARSIYMLVGEARLDLDTSEMFEGYLLKSDDLEGDHVIISFARRLAFLRTRVLAIPLPRISSLSSFPT